MYLSFPRQNLFCQDYDGGHIGKWLPILSQVKSAKSLWLNITRKVYYYNSVPHIMLVSLSAQFIRISAPLLVCCDGRGRHQFSILSLIYKLSSLSSPPTQPCHLTGCAMDCCLFVQMRSLRNDVT